MSFLAQSAIFLAAAVFAVPVSRRLGLGAVLGYLAGGIAIGPFGLGLIADVKAILEFGEFGVVLLLFIIGLEVEPIRLWTMRRYVFGLGAAQVVATGAALAGIGLVFGLTRAGAIVAGLAMALSSTAFALQMLAERKRLPTRYGRASFSVLLFQDLAVVPLLALVPLLAGGAAAPADPVYAVARSLVVIAVVVVAGRYLVRYALRIIAATGIEEIFTAATLLAVVATALLMVQVGLSMALGAFLAGMLLADSEYRHELEADIEPFKGLLLGLFFIAVGMSVNVGLVVERPVLVLSLSVGLLVVKMALLWPLARLYGLDAASARHFATAIPQGGEFAFVVLGLAVGAGIIAKADADLLIVVVIVTMALTPLLVALDERISDRGPRRATSEPARPEPVDGEPSVIIAGFGRVGQIVARTLRARGIGFTALEARPEQVDFVRRYGARIFYGDASRLALLRAAKAEQARAIVIAVDDIEASLRIARVVKVHFPAAAIYARARNRRHAYQLMSLGVDYVVRETFHSSLALTRNLLQGLGLGEQESARTVDAFREHDEAMLEELYHVRDDEQRTVYLTQQAAEELETLFSEDAGATKADDEPASAAAGRSSRA